MAEQLGGEPEYDETVAQSVWKKIRVAQRLISICTILIVFDVGRNFWPGWLIAYQKQTVLSLIGVLFLVVLATPQIIRAVSRVR
jgi:hypothetical protein